MRVSLRIFLIAFLIISLAGASTAFAQSSFFEFLQDQKIGKTAPDFTLKDLNGKTVNMTKYRDGQNAIVFFWATWCPHCRVALKGLNRDHQAIEAQGIKLIIVDVGEEASDVIAHARNNQLALNVLLDVDSAVSGLYGVGGVPTFAFVGQDGKIRAIEHSLPRSYEKLFDTTKK